MQSLSFANDRHLAEQSVSVLDRTCRPSNANGGGGSSSSGVQRGSNGSNAIPRLVQQNTLLSEAAYVPPAPLSEEKKMAWRKAITTVTLAETPTIFLYSHHDEAVSKRCVEEATRPTRQLRKPTASTRVRAFTPPVWQRCALR